MLQYSLIDSYHNFRNNNIPYPFVQKRELKPRALLPDLEYNSQNAFLVLFVEGSIPGKHKKYIRFFDSNRTVKTNLLRSQSIPLVKDLEKYQKYLETAHFFNFLKELLPVDYALLIQRDPSSKSRDRYALTHFHVRIDWPIAEAAEDLARTLRYISKDLYEKGEKYAEDIQKKFFEYYCLPVMVGGRRTAAIVASQFLKRINCITTVYAGSSETRALIRISERGVSKSVLMNFTDDEIAKLAEENHVSIRKFKKNYIAVKEKDQNICIFQAIYSTTVHSRPPEDGKLREIKPDVNWVTVGAQYLLPKPDVWSCPPIPTNAIYS